MNDNSLAGDGIEHRLSARLQVLRAQRGWALDELAAISGISRATLSRIERGDTSPTATQLGRLCTAFGVTFSQLLGGLEAVPAALVPASAQSLWVDPATGFRRRAVSPPAQGLGIELIEGELPPGAIIAYDAAPVNGLEQHVWMLAGRLELTHGGETWTLGPGD
ncbi:MAG: helix-turn-helix domain-containing protein, partial [Asticcacaulis sp.]